MAMKALDTERFLDMCVTLAAERDREALLADILDTAMDLARCDAGAVPFDPEVELLVGAIASLSALS